MITVSETIYDKMPDNIKRHFVEMENKSKSEVLECFPETISKYSESKSTNASSIFFGKQSIKTPNQFIGDRGSASRFFYCAKASPSERNEGLELFETKIVARGNGAQAALARGEQKPAGESFNSHTKTQNHHPTVKPIALMEYLIRLITPKNGIVLDCFAGSGTTGIAAVNEGKQFILIERETEYCEIIKARVKNAINKKQPELFENP